MSRRRGCDSHLQRPRRRAAGLDHADTARGRRTVPGGDGPRGRQRGAGAQLQHRAVGELLREVRRQRRRMAGAGQTAVSAARRTVKSPRGGNGAHPNRPAPLPPPPSSPTPEALWRCNRRATACVRSPRSADGDHGGRRGVSTACDGSTSAPVSVSGRSSRALTKAAASGERNSAHSETPGPRPARAGCSCRAHWAGAGAGSRATNTAPERSPQPEACCPASSGCGRRDGRRVPRGAVSSETTTLSDSRPARKRRFAADRPASTMSSPPEAALPMRSTAGHRSLSSRDGPSSTCAPARRHVSPWGMACRFEETRDSPSACSTRAKHETVESRPGCAWISRVSQGSAKQYQPRRSHPETRLVEGTYPSDLR